MTANGDRNLADLLREKGVRKKLAKQMGKLDGNRRRSGARGEARARRAVEDLGSAAEEIRARVLTSDPKRRAAARKAAQTRKRATATRRAASKKAAKTRATRTRSASRS